MRNLYHVVNALVPNANAFAGTVATSPINMKNWGHCSFIVQCGAGAVGTAKITVEACSDITPTTTVAIPFYYQECVANDTFGAIQKTADNTGFTTSAAANKVYKVEVDNEMLAASGYNYVRLKSVEQTVGAINGGVAAILTEGRFNSEIPASSALV
jgi:hypothetical protein